MRPYNVNCQKKKNKKEQERLLNMSLSHCVNVLLSIHDVCMCCMIIIIIK